MIKGHRPKDVPGGDALPTTAYLMEGERCSRDCAFCPQARAATSRADLLARVNWPEAGGPRFWEGLSRAVAARRLRRACFQVTFSPGVLGKVERKVRALRERCPDLPICVSAAVRDLDEVARILEWGAERVTIALDAANPELYRAFKGGSFEARLALLTEAARRHPGRIGTHLIAGLGETERDMAGLFGTLAGLGVTVALFAFTPVAGTRLAGREPPDLCSYRRLQAARHLIVGGLARAGDMTFDAAGRLCGYGLPWEKAAAALTSGEAFRTSGCPDCNRPYYNERPGGALYNYPRPLTPEETNRAVEEARPVAPASPGPVPSVSLALSHLRSGTAAARPPRSTLPAMSGPRPALSPTWRLIAETRPRPGAENMAVDEAILETAAAGQAPPTLRFYAWDPPALSLGYFQDAEREADLAACRAEGVDVVRRPTGGRAVLHDREVTYSVIVPTGLLPGSVVETYRKLAGGLVLGLREIGLDAAMAPERDTPGGPGSPYGACFEVPSSYEITVGGRKVVGSAQTRRRGVILQHGAILLEFDAARLARTLGFPPEAAPRLAARAAGLSEFFGAGGASVMGWAGTTGPVDAAAGARPPAPNFAEVCRAVARGLEAALGVAFVPDELGPEEKALAERLVREKYSRESWNLKRPPAEEPAAG